MMNVYTNDEYTNQLYISYTENLVRTIYPNGVIFDQNISDIVTITDVDPTLPSYIESESLDPDYSIMLMDTDWVNSEQRSVSASGQQSVLTGTSSYDGYSYMGNRGGYFYAPSTFGYLQRKNSGISTSYSAKQFNFSAGTAISTAAGIVASAMSSNGFSLLVSIASTLLTSVLGASIDYACSATFNVDTFRWDYRVRLNSNYGSIIGSYYRTSDYWRSYSQTTGRINYQYRGNAHDWGYLLSNLDMIKTSIDNYI